MEFGKVSGAVVAGILEDAALGRGCGFRVFGGGFKDGFCCGRVVKDCWKFGGFGG